MYTKGFSHHNCHGRCVRGGLAHFKRLKTEMPEIFNELTEQEHYLKLYVSEYHYIKNLEEDGLDDEVKALWHKQLEDCYRDYFYGRAKRPKTYIPTNLVINQYSFMKRKGGAYPLSFYARDLNGKQAFQSEEDQFDLNYDEAGCGCFLDVEMNDEIDFIEEDNSQIALAI